MNLLQALTSSVPLPIENMFTSGIEKRPPKASIIIKKDRLMLELHVFVRMIAEVSGPCTLILWRDVENQLSRLLIQRGCNKFGLRSVTNT